MNENEQVKVFRVTVKKVIKRLSSVENCNIENFKDKVIEQFEDYNYEGEEELKGIEQWDDLSNDGKYELTVGINHEDAYEFTIYVNVENKKATIYNVL